MKANDFLTRFDLGKIGKPVDRTQWEMTPPTVNAYYNPNLNEIVFPAGILQPPFFDPKADDAVNYGAMGMVIGHELTHGFDDQGRKFDASGNLHDWWTAEDAKTYKERAAADRRSVQPLCAHRRFEDQRRDDAGREHRGPGRSENLLSGVSEDAQGQAGAGEDRRLHGRAALFPVVCHALAHRRSATSFCGVRCGQTIIRRRASAYSGRCTTRRSSSRRSRCRPTRPAAASIPSRCGS